MENINTPLQKIEPPIMCGRVMETGIDKYRR